MIPEIIKNVSIELGNMDYLFFKYLKQNYIWEEANFRDFLNIDNLIETIEICIDRQYGSNNKL